MERTKREDGRDEIKCEPRVGREDLAFSSGLAYRPGAALGYSLGSSSAKKCGAVSPQSGFFARNSSTYKVSTDADDQAWQQEVAVSHFLFISLQRWD